MTVGVRPKNLKKKYLSIVWMSFHRRPFTLSQLVFRGPLYFLGYKIGKNKLLRPVEYVLKFLHTLGIIFLEKPSLVIVQSPPAFAPIAVMFYSLFTRLQYAVDAHTSAITGFWFKVPFHQLSLKKAAVVFVHNRYLKVLLEAKGIKSIVLGDPLPIFNPSDSFKLPSGRFNFVVLLSPGMKQKGGVIDVMLEVAAAIPEANFYFVGKYKEKPTKYASNAIFTGYLSNDEYESILIHADAVVVLQEREDREFVQSCRAMEATSALRPLIITDTSLNRELFGQGAVLVNHEFQDIYRACTTVMRNRDKYIEGIKRVRKLLEDRWQNEYNALKERLSID